MSDKKIRTMVTAAVLAALSCVATMVVQIPSPMNGYVNLGDASCFSAAGCWDPGGARRPAATLHGWRTCCWATALRAWHAHHQGRYGAGGGAGL